LCAQHRRHERHVRRHEPEIARLAVLRVHRDRQRRLSNKFTVHA
jgi:hypothetical protein